MLITVVEARQLKDDYFFWLTLPEKEHKVFNRIVNVFTIWFYVLTTLRGLVAATVIAALVEQETDIMAVWNTGEGLGFFFGYILLTCIPVIGNFVILLAPIAVVIAAFAVGDGIASNFGPYVLPIVLAYVVTFGLVFISNVGFNFILRKKCLETYEAMGGTDVDAEAKRKAANRSNRGNTTEKSKAKKVDNETRQRDRRIIIWGGSRSSRS